MVAPCHVKMAIFWPLKENSCPTAISVPNTSAFPACSCSRFREKQRRIQVSFVQVQKHLYLLPWSALAAQDLPSLGADSPTTLPAAVRIPVRIRFPRQLLFLPSDPARSPRIASRHLSERPDGRFVAVFGVCACRHPVEMDVGVPPPRSNLTRT
eukprot:scaffold1368_cov333-Pavlova_lutheri.AAC.10